MTNSEKKFEFLFKKHSVEIVFSLLFITLAAILNLQFLDGSNINTKIAGHDEYIAVKEVYSLLNPISWKHFILSFIAGDVIYYGRIMFYIDAFFSWLPFKVWGIEGMVYTTRMVHSVFLILGLLILSNVFLKEKFHKALFLLGSGAIFYTLYFLMMPKPEPFQLFFLALFLYYFKQKNWSFGRHFILLGIAFGLKFNVLLILPIIFVLPFLKKNTQILKQKIIYALKAFVYFLIGLIIAIPCLILSPLKPIYFRTYIHETFSGTGKSYDNLSITVFDWLKNGFGGYYTGHWIMGYIFLFVIIIALVLQLRKIKYNNDISALLLLLFGLFLTFIIMFTTKRLWPHYLWTGFIFLYLGLIVFSAQQTSLKYRKVFFTIVSVFISISLGFFLTRDLPLYLGFDKDPEIVKDYKESKQAINYIKYKYPHSRVGTDASLLCLFSDFVVAKPYHPFSIELPAPNQTILMWYGDHPEEIWEEKNDLVVFYKRHPEVINSETGTVRNEKQLKLFQEHIKSDFVRDTMFGDVRIYRRNIR